MEGAMAADRRKLLTCVYIYIIYAFMSHAVPR